VIDPELRAALRTLPAIVPLPILVSFRDTLPIPRFPALVETLQSSAPANKPRLDAIAGLVRRIQGFRAGVRAADSTFLVRRGARILRNHWLVRAYAVEMSVGAIRRLPLAGTDIVQLRLDRGQPPPCHDGYPGNDMREAITCLGTGDWYQAYGYGRIALLDTGVLRTHVMLHAPSMLCLVQDLVNEPGARVALNECSPFDTESGTAGGGDTFGNGHGTSSAAILVGNGRVPGCGQAGEEWFRGVTHATLDALQVYRPDGRLSVSAAIRGIEIAIERGAQVIVAEMQECDEPDVAGLEVAADNAYDAGAIVIAANGNQPGGANGVPARARKAIGVGAYYLEGDPSDYQFASGPTADGRRKPDLVAPTNTETAGRTGVDAMRSFDGTSGATPYAAGAALLLANWVRGNMEQTDVSLDPGQVYALLILSGDRDGKYDSTTATGAGRLRLPSRGFTQFGKTWVDTTLREVDIPIELPREGAVSVSAAIWWPETAVADSTTKTNTVETDPEVAVEQTASEVAVAQAAQDQSAESERTPKAVPLDTHNDLALEIRTGGPFGQMLARSDSDGGVFERATAGLASVGNAKLVLRVIPDTIRTLKPQTVYWAVTMRRAASE